ncbi:MAG: oleate hydratase [Clostridiales bacterium]|nr:oleate hydratase [Clostridiales bacterium]
MTDSRFFMFEHPEKAPDIEKKSAWLVGSGIASLSAACFLIRDGGMDGRRIHILEKNPIAGGALDGYVFDGVGFVMRGDRTLDPGDACLWDLLRSVPADEFHSVLDRLIELNRRDPNYSLCRATESCGADAKRDGAFGLSDKGVRELLHLFMQTDGQLAGKKISDCLDAEVLASPFWLTWRSTYFLENWHSALAFRRTLLRALPHIGTMPEMRDLIFTGSNQYESLVMPLTGFLRDAGVDFRYGVHVTDVAFDTAMNRKIATRIDLVKDGEECSVDLTPDDLLFITIGGCVENSTMGSQQSPAPMNREVYGGGGWALWKRIAAQDETFGRPDAFTSNVEETNGMSATVTLTDSAIIPYIKKICRRDPCSGRVSTGGLVTARDSNWLLSWTADRQPVYAEQPKDQVIIWLSGLFTDKPGNFIPKPMRDASGMEICEEWLYHLGVPVDSIEKLASDHAVTVPVMMPFLTASRMPCGLSDRPAAVPDQSVNFAFLGQFARTDGGSFFTADDSVRTAMQAVYSLLSIDRPVPEAAAGSTDLRVLVRALVAIRDGRPLETLDPGFSRRRAITRLLKDAEGTVIGKMLEEEGAVRQ